MGSNTDYLTDLESFLDNSSAGLISSSGTSPNPIASPLGPSTPLGSNGAGVRDRLRHHINGAEKRKLEDGSNSDLLSKSQRTEDHHLLLDGIDHGFKSEDIKEELDLKDDLSQPGYGNINQGGLLAQALMDKRPNQTNGHLNSQTGYFGGGSPMSGVGSPSVPGARYNPADMNALKQQLQAISKDPNLKSEQKTAKITEFFSQHPNLQRLLMANKMQKDKILRQSLGQDTLMQRDRMVGSPMVHQQQDYGAGFSPMGNGDGFNSGPFMENNNPAGFGGPVPPGPGPRGRGRTALPPSGPSMNNIYQSPVTPMQNEMWGDMNGKCMPGQLPPQPHIHPPPQYPYRQPGPRPNNMINSMAGGCYNPPQGEYMPPGLYGQQQPYLGPRGGGGVVSEPLYPNEGLGPGPAGVRGFNPPMYPGGGGMRMMNPYADGFQNDYIVPPNGRNIRHPEFLYHQHQQRMNNQQQHPMSLPNPQQQQLQQQRIAGPGFGMSISPRLQGNVGQMSPVMSPPMHSPAAVPMSMPPSGIQHNGFSNNIINNNNNNNNSSGNSFNMQGPGSTNGFHFNDDFLGPPIQSPGINPTVGMMEDVGMDSILGVDDSSSSAQFNTNWKINASDSRRDFLQRIQNSLKDNQLDSEASAMEEEAFNVCDTQESYVHRLAQWLAGKFSLLQETPHPYPDSTTVQENNLSCPKLSSSTDLVGNSDSSSSDMLAKANPLLAESLLATNDEQVNNPSGELKDKESFSTSSSASSSPATSSTTTTTTSAMTGLCSPMSQMNSLTSGGGMISTAATTTTTTSSTPSIRNKNDNNFHRPNSESVQQTADKGGILRTVHNRRPSGKGTNSSNNNNPHSVDSGIGSPRSTTSSSLYSPKLHGTSPSLVAVSNSETSPGKLS